MTQPLVFVSYSQQDEAEKDQLLSHLGVLQHAGLIDVWNDERIAPGSDWQTEISRAIDQAQAAILLISANLLTTRFILADQIPDLLKRRQSEGLVVFPIIAKPCAWRKVPWLRRMSVRPRNGQPVWRAGGIHADEELAVMAEEVAAIIEEKASRDTQDLSGGLPVEDTSDLQIEGIHKQLVVHQRRLQIRQEQRARYGINTPPEILIEIEDIKAEIERLQQKLSGR